MQTPPRSDFGSALRIARKAVGLPQEAFDQISSRTYISSLERGLKTPTILKVDDLATVLKVHPLTLLALCYLPKPTPAATERLLNRVTNELQRLTLIE
ncbi:helix-turn-helix transcriptional regulator [Variovorax rhizosphaerae]|uniref:Helix-turn-helix transcriptional regulator n=1 Tax=Variovorax rhizosphaerae TaxID=1836200 RepID=A0ABU8WTC5_9BURK